MAPVDPAPAPELAIVGEPPKNQPKADPKTKAKANGKAKAVAKGKEMSEEKKNFDKSAMKTATKTKLVFQATMQGANLVLANIDSNADWAYTKGSADEYAIKQLKDALNNAATNSTAFLHDFLIYGPAELKRMHFGDSQSMTLIEANHELDQLPGILDANIEQLKNATKRFHEKHMVERKFQAGKK